MVDDLPPARGAGDHGFVTHLEEERRYGLGVAAFELGSAYQRQAPLQRIARPLLGRLVDTTTHNAHLAVLHGRDVLYVIEERAPGRPLLVTDVGPLARDADRERPGHARPAAGRPGPRTVPAPRHPRAARRSRTHLRQRARRELTQVRTRGYALEDDSVSVGLSSVARAVLDHTGHPVAGVALTFPRDEVDETERSRPWPP